MKLRDLIVMLQKTEEHVGGHAEVSYCSCPNSDVFGNNYGIHGLVVAFCERDPAAMVTVQSAVDMAMGAPSMAAKVVLVARPNGVQ